MAYSRTTRMTNQMLAAWKWLLSFGKSQWTLNDYPIRVATQRPDPAFNTPRFSQHLYRAYIVNAAITGLGNTRDEAMAGLAQNFKSVWQRRKHEEKPAIRPGTNWPLEFASQEKVSCDEALSEEFIQKVLGLEWAWISDESSLWDFHTNRQMTSCMQRFVKFMASTFQTSNRQGCGLF